MFPGTLAGRAAFAEAGSITMTVVDVDGESHAGTLEDLTQRSVALSIDKRTRTFAARDVLRIEFPHKRLKDHLSGAVIFLANGDRLAARPKTIDDTAAQAQWTLFPGWKPATVPLETIAGFILEVPDIKAARAEALRTVMDRRQKADLVDLKNGDQASGEFVGLDEKVLRLESAVGETAIERDSIRLVTMNRELVSFPKVTGPSMLLSLTDGSQITVTDLKRAGEDRLAAKAAFGAPLDLPISAVVSIRCLGGRAVYLSDLEPARYEQQPYLAGHWDLKPDRNVLGEPLRLDGREYPKGLGMHSRSAVSYDLDGKFQTFRATAGVDDAAQAGGSVVFKVDVDGKQIFQKGPQTAGQSALMLPPISVAGAKRLTLRVEFGQFGDVRDYADWCDAVLIRPPE